MLPTSVPKAKRVCPSWHNKPHDVIQHWGNVAKFHGSWRSLSEIVLNMDGMVWQYDIPPNIWKVKYHQYCDTAGFQVENAWSELLLHCVNHQKRCVFKKSHQPLQNVKVWCWVKWKRDTCIQISEEMYERWTICLPPLYLFVNFGLFKYLYLVQVFSQTAPHF